MSITYAELVINNGIRALNNLSHLLDKGLAYCLEKKIDEQVMLNARLFPDMFPFSLQVQIAVMMCINSADWLIGKEVKLPEKEKEVSFRLLQIQIQQAIAYLEHLDKVSFEGCEHRKIRLPWRPDKVMRGKTFLLQHAIPQIYFHVTTAYDILRHNAVPIGKADYVGNVDYLDE